MDKPDLEELRYRFLKQLSELAPGIIADLFEKKDAVQWARHWEIESDWIIETATHALEMRPGPTIEQAWLKVITGIRFAFKPPALEIETFGEDETYHYLSREEFDRRIKQKVDQYYDQYFSNREWFDEIGVRKYEQFIKWLVLKIGGRTDEQIAEIENLDIDESTIRKGRLKAANCLELKKKGKGRPRKRK